MMILLAMMIADDNDGDKKKILLSHNFLAKDGAMVLAGLEVS